MNESKPQLGFATDESADHSTSVYIEFEISIVIEAKKVNEYNHVFAKGSVAETACEIGNEEAKLRVEGTFQVMYLSDPSYSHDRKLCTLGIALRTYNQS